MLDHRTPSIVSQFYNVPCRPQHRRQRQLGFFHPPAREGPKACYLPSLLQQSISQAAAPPRRAEALLDRLIHGSPFLPPREPSKVACLPLTVRATLSSTTFPNSSSLWIGDFQKQDSTFVLSPHGSSLFQDGRAVFDPSLFFDLAGQSQLNIQTANIMECGTYSFQPAGVRTGMLI